MEKEPFSRGVFCAKLYSRETKKAFRDLLKSLNAF